ncbi:hypothetical protein [Mucilaginibacter antarcticus]|uniref:YD repeat-containing protein n=1 Tax=Mucilaginibacter antarcticus TaxID=1855725 RepID=A0ABW5XM42_9SPHI
MNLSFKLPLACLVFMASCSICFAQYSDGKNPAWAPVHGKIDSVIINGFAVTNTGKDQSKQNKYKLGLAYNEDGQLGHQDMYTTSVKQQPTAPDRIQLRIINNYDIDRRLIGMTIYHGDTYGSKSSFVKEVYSYKNDTLIEAKRYGMPGDVLLSVTQIRQDKAGNVIERSTSDTSQKLISRFTTTYNAHGERIEATEHHINITPKDRRWTHTYDKKGNLIKDVYYAGAGAEVTSTVDYKYTKFDKQHNWLVKNIYSEGKLAGVVEREITYRK